MYDTGLELTSKNLFCSGADPGGCSVLLTVFCSRQLNGAVVGSDDLCHVGVMFPC